MRVWKQRFAVLLSPPPGGGVGLVVAFGPNVLFFGGGGVNFEHQNDRITKIPEASILKIL